MAEDKILVPFGIDQSGFKGDIDDLLKYLEKQAGKSLDGIGNEIVKRFTKGSKKGQIESLYKQLIVPMADGTIASVLLKQTKAGGKLSSAKGSVKVYGGFVKEQVPKLQGATSLKEYDETIKKSTKESLYLRQVNTLSKKFESAKLSKNRGAIDSLLSSISEYKKVGESYGFSTDGLDTLNKDVEKYKTNFEKVEHILERVNSRGGGYFEKQKTKLDETNKKLSDAKLKLEQYVDSGKDTKLVEREIKRLNKELSKLGRQPPLTGIQKFINTIKRVGFYRIARNLFRFIEAGFGSASKNLIEIDDGVNKTMSSLATSADKISSSFAMILLPALSVIEPMVTSFADRLVEVANGISEAQAQMKGLSTYTKISEEYMKDLREASNSLPFDKFNALSNGGLSPYKKATVDPNKDLSVYKGYIDIIQRTATNVSGIISDIFRVAKQLFDIISPHIDTLLKVVGNLVVILTTVGYTLTDIIVKVISWLDKNDLLVTAIYGLVAVFVTFKALSIATMFINIAEKVLALNTALKTTNAQASQMGKLLSVKGSAGVGLGASLSGILGIALSINNVIDSINDIQKWDGATSGAKQLFDILKLVASVALGIASIMGVITGNPLLLGAGIIGGATIGLFANGGIAQKGDLFFANDAGPELVYSGHNNSSSIMNISQFKEAMVEAIYECSDVFQNSSGDVVLNLDGAEIANSKRFVSAMNRKNAGLNLR